MLIVTEDSDSMKESSHDATPRMPFHRSTAARVRTALRPRSRAKKKPVFSQPPFPLVQCCPMQRRSPNHMATKHEP